MEKPDEGREKEVENPYLHRTQTHYRRRPALKLINNLPSIPHHSTKATILEFRENRLSTVGVHEISQLEAHLESVSSCPYYSPKPDHDGWQKDSATPSYPSPQGHGQSDSEREDASRLYIIQDISLPWISVLGQYFNIDPLFFASYLKFDPDRTQNFVSNYTAMRRLPSLRESYNFMTFVYHEIRTFLETAPRREEYEIRTRDNVGRLVTTVDHHFKKSGRQTGLIRRNLGVWWRWRGAQREGSGAEGNEGEVEDERRDGKGEYWDAVVLVDPPTPSFFDIRRWEGGITFLPISCLNTTYLDGILEPVCSDWPIQPPFPNQKMGTQQIPPSFSFLDPSCTTTESPDLSMLAYITTHWQCSSPHQINSARSSPKLAALPALRYMTSHWNLQLDYLVAVASEAEKGLLKFEQMDAHPSLERITSEVILLRRLLSDVNAWRRRLFFYEEHILINIENTSLPSLAYAGENLGKVRDSESGRAFHRSSSCLHSGTNTSDSHGPSSPNIATNMNPWAPVHHDLLTTQSHLHLQTSRIQSLLPVVMGAFELLEARRSVIKDELTIRLSGIALVFVPLSFTAEFLSMSDDFQPGRRLFWVFFVVTGPLIGALVWWGLWGEVRRVRRFVGRYVERRTGSVGG